MTKQQKPKLRHTVYSTWKQQSTNKINPKSQNTTSSLEKKTDDNAKQNINATRDKQQMRLNAESCMRYAFGV